MPLKVWNGSSWATSTGIKVWNGSSWVTAAAGKVWNGSSWVDFLFSLGFSPNVAFDQRARASSSPGGYAYAQFTLNTNGTVSSAGVTYNSGGGSGGLDVDSKPTSWGIPTTTSIGSNFEARILVTYLAKNNGGEICTWGGTNVPAEGSYSAWVTLSSNTSLFAGVGDGYGGSELFIAGTLYVRNKTSLTEVSQSFNMEANVNA
jgi:hypothetical protein